MSDDESRDYINKTFRDLKTENKLFVNSTFSFRTTNSEEVLQLLNKIDSSSTAGNGDISTKILKSCASIIASSLAKMFNSCISSASITFDLIDPKLLFLKLFHYGFDNSALSLVRSYFDGRRQVTKVSEVCSEPLDLLIGLPQGSVLGPLFFLIFINDLTYMLSLATTLFADDTTIYTAHKDLERQNYYSYQTPYQTSYQNYPK